MKRVVLALCLCVALSAKSQTIQKVNQGQPGTQGPWPVILSGGSTSTDGGQFGGATYPAQCAALARDGGSVNQNTFVGGTATQVPVAPSAGRLYVNICNSPQNLSTAFVKCRADSTAPSLTPGLPGDGLLYGDCILYTAPTDPNIIRCITDGGGGYDGGPASVTSYECVP